MMYVNKKRIKPFTLMEFEDEQAEVDSDPVLDAVQVEEQP